jgi:hypothetical protein
MIYDFNMIPYTNNKFFQNMLLACPISLEDLVEVMMNA